MIQKKDQWRKIVDGKPATVCRHCNRGVSVVGELNERGFCLSCVLHGYHNLYIDEVE
ncbi:MAG: hypothetical protein HXS54_06075 [Theionarchaea archaeon]|nr:hypothetical protein [Theionarchaea archaeon]DBA34826.1 TPA_asm: hypothetical protein vir521_00032 [Caudoviricetes sp. vir521]